MKENTRVKNHFLLFPLIINGEKKWFRYASYLQKYYPSVADNIPGGWKNIKWI